MIIIIILIWVFLGGFLLSLVVMASYADQESRPLPEEEIKRQKSRKQYPRIGRDKK